MSDSEEDRIEKQLKIAFVGEPNVGKTSIIRRFCHDEFTRQYVQTIGADFYIRRLLLAGEREITIKITDVGGLELHRHMFSNYVFSSNVIFLVYDITNSNSFDCLSMWIDRINRVVKKKPIYAILGNKFIEKYTENVRFCIICNYLSKIIPALQSRCTRFRFGPLSPDQIMPRLNYVIDEEKVKVSQDGKQALLTLANGDMRKVLNVLQSTWLAYKDVTEDNVYSCVGHPLKSDIESIVKWLLNENFQTAFKNIKELKVIKGLALHDIISEIHRYVHRIEFPFEILIELLDVLAEIEFRLVSGTNENIQLTSLISAFQHAKDVTPPEPEEEQETVQS